jgi:hypothetical protein
MQEMYHGRTEGFFIQERVFVFLCTILVGIRL